VKTDSLVECLYTCSVCGQAGFTLRGLRAHCCRSKPGRARLTNAEIGRSLSPSAPNETAGRLPRDARNRKARGEQVEAAGEALCGAKAAFATGPATARRMTGASTPMRPGVSGASLRAPGTCGSEQPSSCPAVMPATVARCATSAALSTDGKANQAPVGPDGKLLR
jgi:hypothetical protein